MLLNPKILSLEFSYLENFLRKIQKNSKQHFGERIILAKICKPCYKYFFRELIKHVNSRRKFHKIMLYKMKFYILQKSVLYRSNCSREFSQKLLAQVANIKKKLKDHPKNLKSDVQKFEDKKIPIME